jgi:peptidylprolyl isomerase
MTPARKGDVVKIRYTGLAADGTQFGTSENDAPLEFTLGSAQTIEGLNQALIGMQDGERKTVTVPLEQGFGPREPKRIYQLKRSSLPSNVRIGDRLTAQAGNQAVPIWVTNLDDEFATVDANHPLAGQSVVLHIELVAVVPQKAGIQKARKIHVGNLPRASTADDLRSLFGAFGAVRSVEIINHRPTSKSQGFAFVEMETTDASTNALRELNGRDFHGQALSVSEARDQPAQAIAVGAHRPPARHRNRRAPST